MDAFLEEKINELNSMEQEEFWYIVKQGYDIAKLCYLLSFLQKFQSDINDTELNCENYIKKCIDEHNASDSKLKFSNENYRTLLGAAFLGLLRKTSNKYADAIISEQFHEIEKRCGGCFENTDSYKDILETQIEKMFISTDVDEEFNGKRRDFRLYSTMLLYKVLLEIGRATGEYKISAKEFKLFVATTKKYEESSSTVFYILKFRETKNSDSIQVKLPDTRMQSLLKLLPSLSVTENDIGLKKEYIETVSRKIYLFETQQNPEPTSEFLTSKRALVELKNIIPFPHNRIIFGAPGTGKSFQLKEDQEECFNESHFERVTFHPNYSYAQFVGTYKPVMKESKDISSLTDEQKKIYQILIDKSKNAEEKYNAIFEIREPVGLTRIPILLALYSDDDSKYVMKREDGTPSVPSDVEKNHGKKIRPFVKLLSENDTSDISYEYIPGPFVRILEKALKNPNENYLLLIEEINRANVAAVFGDVFQLLDRDSDGNSEYEIDASNDLEKYLNDNGITLENHKLKIPNNMYIWATMNSADQGVMPLDAAFKRRWNFEYLNIDANENEVKDIVIPNTKKEDGSYTFVKWNLFRKALNDKLKTILSLNVNEDKLLGPFFISLKDLTAAENNPDDFVKLFKSKVLMYLFEDVCKMNPPILFDGINIGGRIHYSDVCEKFDKLGIGIFNLTENDLLKFDK